MINLRTYLYEKLVVNKNYRLRNMGDINDITKEICNKCDNAIGEKNQVSIKINVESPAMYYDSLGQSAKSITTIPNEEDLREMIVNKELKNSTYLVKFLGSNIEIHIFFVENKFLLIYFRYCKRGEMKQIIPIMEQYNFIMHDIEDDYYSNYYWREYFEHDSPCDVTDFEDIMGNLLVDIAKELNIVKIVSKLKSGEVLPGYTIDDIKKRYDKIFDDVKVTPYGNVKLGHLREHGIDRSYENSTFTIVTDIQYRGGVMIRRKPDFSSGSGNNFVLKPNADEAFDDLDRKLKIKGYTV